MTAEQMAYEFNVAYDFITNFEAPGYNNKEISTLLTGALEEVVKEIYAKGSDYTEKQKKAISKLFSSSKVKSFAEGDHPHSQKVKLGYPENQVENSFEWDSSLNNIAPYSWDITSGASVSINADLNGFDGRRIKVTGGSTPESYALFTDSDVLISDIEYFISFKHRGDQMNVKVGGSEILETIPFNYGEAALHTFSFTPTTDSALRFSFYGGSGNYIELDEVELFIKSSLIDYLFITQERADVNIVDGIFEGITKNNVLVKPITDDYYNLNVDNPNKSPGLEVVWRLDTNSSGEKAHELITNENAEVGVYYLKGYRKPKPIIVAWDEYVEEDGQIDGYAFEDYTDKSLDCELDSSVHREIIEKAVGNAYQANKDAQGYQISSTEEQKKEAQEQRLR